MVKLNKEIKELQNKVIQLEIDTVLLNNKVSKLYQDLYFNIPITKIKYHLKKFFKYLFGAFFSVLFLTLSIMFITSEIQLGFLIVMIKIGFVVGIGIYIIYEWVN